MPRNKAKTAAAEFELMLTLSQLLPRRPARRRRKRSEWRATGSPKRCANGEYYYGPVRLKEEDVSKLLVLVNTIRHELKMNPVPAYLDPEA